MLITQNELKAVIHYDPETGIFTWLARPRMRSGKVAGGPHNRGYYRLHIGGRTNGQSYLAHRLAWLYMTGELPEQDIDHINGDRTDNRFCNLRSVTRAVNLQNLRGPRKDNRTGFLGVRKTRSGYDAHITTSGKQKYLGAFTSPELAHQAYLTAKRELHEGCTI